MATIVDTYKKFSKEVLLISIMSALTSVSDLILLSILTKNLGAQEYGIWTQVQATINLVVPIASLGLPFAMVRFLASEKEKRAIQEGFYSIITVVVLVNLVVAIIMIAFPGFIADRFFDSTIQIVRITGLLSLAFALNGVYLAFFRTFRRIKTYSVCNIARAYGEVGLVTYLVLSGHGVLDAVLALLVARSTLFLIMFFLVKAEIGLIKPRFLRLKEYLRFSLPTVASNIGGWVIALSDRFVITYLLGVAAVGIYSAAYMIATASTFLAGVLGFILPAASSQLYDEERINELRTHLSYSLKYAMALSIPFVFGAIIISEPVLRMFSTEEIAAQGRWVLPIVAVGFVFLNACIVPGQILILVKKTQISAIALTISAVVNVGLNILVVPRVGIYGAAITTMIAYFLLLVIQSYYAFKDFKFTIDWNFIMKSLAASVIMSLAIWWIRPVGIVATILTIALGIVVYGGALFLLKGLSREEINLFKGLLKRST